MRKTMKKIAPQATPQARPMMQIDPAMMQAEFIKRKNQGINSEEDVKALFSLPATLAKKSNRVAMDEAFESVGGYSMLFDSLSAHAARMGQFPYTSFVGYGALQQIAQNGMIRNCIKTVADDVTREWITIKGGPDTPPEKIAELQNEQEKFDLRGIFNRAITMVGFMGGAFVFIKTDVDNEDGRPADLSLPLYLNNKCAEIEKGSKLSFLVVDPMTVSPSQYNATDPLEKDYMSPSQWLVLGRQVHKTRLVRLVANEPPTLLKPAYNFLGIPQAQILWDYVLHWNECRVAAQELIKKLSLIVYFTDAQDKMSSPGGIQMMDAVMEMLQHYRDNNSVFLANSETDRVENIQTSVGGVEQIVRQAQEMIAAVNRTPEVKLFGISPSGFNATGESDIRNYNDHLRSQQELYRAQIQRCLNAIQLQLWGEIDPGISFAWNELDMDNESAQSMNFNARVTALATLKDRNIISAEEMRQAIRSESAAHLDFLSDDLPEETEGDLLTDDGSQDILDALRGKTDEAENNAGNGAERRDTAEILKEAGLS